MDSNNQPGGPEPALGEASQREALLDRILEQASEAPENPWFVTQTMHRLKAKKESMCSRFFGLFRPRPIVWIGAATAILAAVFLWGFPLESATEMQHAETLGYTEIPDLEIVVDLDLYLADLQSDLWNTDTSSL